MIYAIKYPKWLRFLFPGRIWEMFGTKDKTIYLTFDDGPHPEHTDFVLNTLQDYNAKATFFCIGKNVETHPDVFNRIVAAGHAIGNHTHNHLNGWKTPDDTYLNDVDEAFKKIESSLFRPPYGKLTNRQASLLKEKYPGLKIIMWTVLSGDFDQSISKEKCLQNVLSESSDNAIVVFHDSEKASTRLRYALPEVLRYFSERGFSFKSLTV